MEPRSEQYVLGEDYVVCSAEELGFAPRAGYTFAGWSGPGGATYAPGQTIRIYDRTFDLSAIWKPSVTVVRFECALSAGVDHAASPSGRISVDTGD